jgi:hypothetical protein
VLTATNAKPNQQLLKPVLLSVPLFINEGDKKIDTASGSYMERVKE